jgi:ribosomal protein S15P/S13E
MCLTTGKMDNTKLNNKVSDITQDLWKTFSIGEPDKNRREKEITFLIRKIAELELKIEKLMQG